MQSRHWCWESGTRPLVWDANIPSQTYCTLACTHRGKITNIKCECKRKFIRDNSSVHVCQKVRIRHKCLTLTLIFQLLAISQLWSFLGECIYMNTKNADYLCPCLHNTWNVNILVSNKFFYTKNLKKMCPNPATGCSRHFYMLILFCNLH